MWFFEEKNKRGRWKRLAWRMTEEDARHYAERHGVELRKVEWSREERENYYGDGRGYGSGVPPAPGKE
jgi:hypothetical protein